MQTWLREIRLCLTPAILNGHVSVSVVSFQNSSERSPLPPYRSLFIGRSLRLLPPPTPASLQTQSAGRPRLPEQRSRWRRMSPGEVLSREIFSGSCVARDGTGRVKKAFCQESLFLPGGSVDRSEDLGFTPRGETEARRQGRRPWNEVEGAPTAIIILHRS